jgi:hypothetical protein
MTQYSDIYDNDELLRQVAFDEITKNLIKENDCNKRIDILSITFDKLCPNQKIQSEVEKNAVALEVAMKKDPYSTIKAVQENDARVKAHGEVFTPLSLVRDMLAPLPDSVWRNPDLKWIDNSCGSGVFLSEIKRKLMLTLRKVITDPIERERHIVENMIYGVDIQASNVFYARKNVRGNSNFTPNIKYWNALEYNYWNGIKFDVVVGNPPYNDNEERKGTVNSLYDNFVYKFFEIANPDAYLVYVHPSKWREGDNPLGELMKSKKIHFLEIHDAKDGKKVFKRDTRYDFYVLQNTDNDGSKTVIIDEKGEKNKVVINKNSTIYNSNFALIEKLLAKDGEECCDILHSNKYDHRKPYLSTEETSQHIYPVLYSVYVNGSSPKFLYASKKFNEHFDKPKILWGQNANVFLMDKSGEIGCSEFASALICDEDEIDSIYKVLSSKLFQDIIKMTTFKKGSSWQVMKKFKKDFWKEFDVV